MSLFNFPNQRIAERKKNNEEWHKSHILGYIEYSATVEYTKKRNEIAELFYAYNAIISKKKEKIIKATITERYGANLGPQYEIYPLIESIIEQGIGEYRLRPLKRRAMANNEGAVMKKLEEKVDMVTESIIRDENSKMQQAIGFAPESENQEMQIPENIQEFFEKDYRTIAEEVGEDVIYQVLIVNKEKEKIYDLLRMYLISGRTVAFIDERDGHPSIFVPHPLDCFFDIDPQEVIQKKPSYFVYDKYLTLNEVLNKYDQLSEEQIANISAYFNSQAGKNPQTSSNSANAHWFRSENGMEHVRVVSMRWISRRKIRFKSFVNTEGKEELKILPDEFKERPRDKDSIKYIEVEDERYVTMIGPDVVLDYGRVEKQMKKLSAPKKRFIPMVALMNENLVGTGEIRSLAKKLLYLQDFASEVLYEIRLSVRQLDGNALVYDLANIPKEWMKNGIDNAIQYVNFHLKRDRTQYINSRDKRSNPYASSVNVSQKGRLDEVLKLFAVIEDLAKKISGFMEGRTGEASEYSKASVAEMNRMASTARTEEYFGIFDTFLETVLERVVVKSKHIYEENKIFTYFGGDNQMQFLKIYPDYFLEDLGIHIGDNRKEFEKSREIDEMAKQAFVSPNNPEMMLELLKIFNADGASEKEAIFKKGMKQLQAMQQENIKQQQEMAKQDLQQKAADKDKDVQVKREGYDKDRDVALIYANNKADDTREKQANENLRKAADIEKDLIINDKKNKE